MRRLAPLVLAAVLGACATPTAGQTPLVLRCDESDGEYPAYLRLAQGEARFWDRDAGRWGENRCAPGGVCELTAATFLAEGAFSLTLNRATGSARFDDGDEVWGAMCRPFEGELPRN